jgi:hypothetical protein
MGRGCGIFGRGETKLAGERRPVKSWLLSGLNDVERLQHAVRTMTAGWTKRPSKVVG